MKRLLIFLAIVSCCQLLLAQTENKENEINPDSIQYSDSASYRPERIYSTKPFTNDKSKKKNKSKKKEEIKVVDEKNISDNLVFLKQNLINDQELVMIPVSVFNEKGEFIADLKKEELKIFEDGVEQEISFFGVPDTPLNIFLLIDKSPSFDAYQKEIIKSLETLVNLLKTEDKILVAQFGQKLKIKTPLRDDRKKIIDAIEDKNIEEGTSIYDTIKTLEDEHLQKNSGQYLVVFVTDGVDTTSIKENYESALKIAEKSNAVFFPIIIDTSQQYGKNSKNRRSTIPKNSIAGDILRQILSSKSIQIITGGVGQTEEEYKIGEQFMTELAASTGGRIVSVDPKSNDLKKAFEIVGVTIRLQQFIGYKSNSLENNKRKELKVRVNRPNLIVRIRDNYY